jgi:hypothetical protein
MNLTEANRVWEALIISNGLFNFGESTTIMQAFAKAFCEGST